MSIFNSISSKFKESKSFDTKKIVDIKPNPDSFIKEASQRLKGNCVFFQSQLQKDCEYVDSLLNGKLSKYNVQEGILHTSGVLTVPLFYDLKSRLVNTAWAHSLRVQVPSDGKNYEEVEVIEDSTSCDEALENYTSNYGFKALKALQVKLKSDSFREQLISFGEERFINSLAPNAQAFFANRQKNLTSITNSEFLLVSTKIPSYYQVNDTAENFNFLLKKLDLDDYPWRYKNTCLKLLPTSLVYKNNALLSNVIDVVSFPDVTNEKLLETIAGIYSLDGGLSLAEAVEAAKVI